MPEIETLENGGFRSAGKNWIAEFDLPSPGLFTFKLGKNLEFVSRYAVLDGLEEATALHGRRKVHLSNDEEEAQLETVCTIPFGAEPSINRKFRLMEGFLSVTTDFIIRSSFRVQNISAGGFELNGEFARFALLDAPASGVTFDRIDWRDAASAEAGTVLYDSVRPPVALLIETMEGAVLEIAVGEDYWRWCALQPDASSSYRLARTASGIEADWGLYQYHPQPEVEVPFGRNRRMSWYLAWRGKAARGPKAAFTDVFDMAVFAWNASQLAVGPDGATVPGVPCFASAGVINTMKKWVRQHLAEAEEGDIFAVTNVRPVCCCSAAHQDRAKQKILPHLTNYAVNDFKRWANKQLSQKGAKLVIVPAEGVAAPSI